MKYITHFSRLFVGILFIISGLIKLNDPLGFSFKLEEYFAPDVLNLPFLIPLALAFSLFVVIFEVVLGVALLLGYRKKLTLGLLLSMIVFFTFLTFYSAYFNKVTDCGCFGDAIPLQPWESFGKDIVLLVFILILYSGKKYINPILSDKMNLVVLSISLVLCGLFGNHVLNHLPVKDFRAFAEGKSLVDGMKPAEELGLQGPVYEVIYTMQKMGTTERIEITGTRYVDEKWWEKKDWEILDDLTRDEKIKDGYEPPIHDFSITTLEGDITEVVLSEKNYLLIISYRLDKANKEGFQKIADEAWKLENSDIPMLALTSSAGDVAEKFRHEIQAPFEFGSMDETTLKTIIRSNPGIVWLKNGVVYKKWHYNDLPSAEELKSLR